jgi:hypothetical protein
MHRGRSIMKATLETDSKVWFLASGTKKIGPLSEARVLERIAEGKVSPRVKAWKEGMDEWQPVGSIPEFAGAETLVHEPSSVEKPVEKPEESEKEPEAKAKPEAKKPLLKRRSNPKVAALVARLPEGGSFEQPYRIERDDLWRAFEIGFDVPRIKVALIAMGVVLFLLLGSAFAAWLHVILGAICALGAVPLSLGMVALTMGALSYQTRRSIETGETPAPGEAFQFAKKHAAALILSPVVVSILAVVPPIALGIKSLISWIPSVGPPAAGLSFGIDLALSAFMFFMLVASSFAWQLVPSIVAFEEQGVIGTVKTVLATVRSRVVRLLFWARKPLAALGGLSLGLMVLAAVVTVVPAALNMKALGINFTSEKSHVEASPEPGTEPGATENSTEEQAPAHALSKYARPSLPPMPSFDLSVGLFGMIGWTAVLLAIVFAVLASTTSALNGLLYLACRAGNDDRITRDDYLAARQGVTHATS